MQACPKCKSHYGDEMKICRTCGAILEVVAEEPPRVDAPLPPEAVEASPASLEEDVPHEATPPGQPSWKCLQCGQSVPGDFEVCWNCGASRDGKADPYFNREPAEDDDDDSVDEVEDNGGPAAEEDSEPRSTGRSGPRCPKCGSSKIIPRTRILDQGEYSDGSLKVVIDGDPNALIFKDRLYGRLAADVCGDCGHVELTVENPSELYEHYLRSKDGAGD
jgi:hypothetical protein